MNKLEQRVGMGGQDLGFGEAPMTSPRAPNTLGMPLVTDDEENSEKLQKIVIKIKSIA